ncbi:sulfurtransferase TusA family protein [Yunchengibacter salinarum]|uniref:sulfurtransferase TusA family protein n=1 Tax=Yunchengibacter salinarum TaxID=3133399 RepID=UPI0035B69009
MTGKPIIHHLDATGLEGPQPILEVRRALKTISPEMELEVTTTDPESVPTMEAFCRMAGHRLMMAERRKSLFIFRIRPGNSGT